MDLGFTTLRLPGYGHVLEAGDPDTRSRLAAWQAPEGFEDVVAGVVPLAADADATPHWGVTFGVDDTDATAAMAAELGGAIVTPPHDAGAIRAALLRDPHGAAFTVAKFDPEDSSG